MTILERKALAIQQILNTDDQQFERLEMFLKTLKTECIPGQDTVEDMREGVSRAARDYDDGLKNYISHEEMISTFPL